MSTARVDVWIWALIYVGMFMVILGLSVRSTSPAIGWVMVGFGVVISVTGAALIWIRSRMIEPTPGPMSDESTAARNDNLKRRNP